MRRGHFGAHRRQTPEIAYFGGAGRRAVGRKCQHAQQAHLEARVLVRRKMQVVTAVQRDLVVQLDFFRRQHRGEPLDIRSLAVAVAAVGVVLLVAIAAA